MVCFFRQDSAAVRFYCDGETRQITVANYDIVPAEYSVKFLGFWEIFPNKFFKNAFQMFLPTFTLYGGLNHIIFLCPTLFEGCWAFW